MGKAEKQNILIVDDDPEALRLMESILSSLKVNIMKAASGDEALDRAAHDNFALMLMDVHMPGVDGFSVAESLRSNEKTKHIPIIFITAVQKKQQQVFHGYELGAVDYIIKPMDPEILVGKVNVFLKLHRQRHLLEKEILERKHAEEEAKTACKQKDRFLSVIAHDIRVPFIKILDSLRGLLDDSGHPLQPRHREVVLQDIDEGERLSEMISELVKIGRLRSGMTRPKPYFIDGLTTALYSIAKLKDASEKKGIQMECEVPGGTRLYADPKLFMEVIQNLVSNSVKYCKEGDKITLFVPKDKPTAIAVSDTGTGMDEAMQKKLFSGEEKTTTPGTWGEIGTGLGLLLSRDIMEAHGGALEFESTPGEGSVFYAKLPVVNPIILVVEDDPNVRKLVRKMLKQVDAEIVEAQDGNDAWDKLAEIRPHLVITDIQMPAMDGFELLIKIRSNPATEDIPVIVLTSDSKQKTWEKAYQLKADDFVPKPFDEEELVPRVRRFI